MLGKMPWGWGLAILCVLFATCGGGLVKDKDPGPATETPPGRRNATLTCHPPERRRTLEHDDFEVLPDGTLLVWQSRDSVNASSYALGEDGTANACLPPPRCADDFVVMKPLYFATMSLLFHAQVPIYVLTNLCFNRWSSLAYVGFLYIILIVYITSPFCQVFKYSIGSFVTLWYSVPSYLSLTGLHLAGGLAALHSDVVLNFLVERGQIYMRKGTVFIRKVGLIATGAACTGAVIFTFTCILVLSGPFDDVTLEFSPLRPHMHYFLPSCLVYLVVNLILAVLSACVPLAAISGDEWQQVRNRHPRFFFFFIVAFGNWMWGFGMTLIRRWNLWDAFVIFSFVFPIVLCCYIYSISRKVIYADWECVKILETTGEVLTIWTYPPKSREEAGSDKVKKLTEREYGLTLFEQPAGGKEKQPDEKETALAFFVEETGAGKEKKPAEKEIINQLALVRAKFRGDKEKQLEEEDFELSLLI